VFCVFYIRAHPLVFNESVFTHAHCIVITGESMDSFAADHNMRRPGSDHRRDGNESERGDPACKNCAAGLRETFRRQPTSMVM
jgi:hypothetical protein